MKRNTIHRQQGGTLVGVVVGLIVGLGIALAVALAITKTPMPFISKVAKPEKTETTAGQITDPNKALYGNRAAAKEAAAKGVTKEQPEASVPASAAASASASDPIARMAEQKEAEQHPAQSSAVQPPNTVIASARPVLPENPRATEIKIPESKPAERKTSAKDSAGKSDAGDDKWTYFLQAGAFREPTDAENTRAKLALMGVEARVTEKHSENGILYRVRIGPFAQLDALNKVRGKLSDNGVDAAVVRIAKQN